MSGNVVFVTATDIITVHAPTGFVTAPSPSLTHSSTRSTILRTLTTILNLPTISAPPTPIESSSSPDSTSTVNTPGLRALIFATFVLIVLVYIFGSIALILLWFRKECPQCQTLRSQVRKILHKPHNEGKGPEVEQEIGWKAAKRERKQTENEEEVDEEREKNRASALGHLEGKHKPRNRAHSSNWFGMGIGFKNDADGSKTAKGKGSARVNSVISPNTTSQDRLFTMDVWKDDFVPTPLGATSIFSNTSSYYPPHTQDIEKRENNLGRTLYDDYREASARGNGEYYDSDAHYPFIVEPMKAGERVPCDNLINDAYRTYNANPSDGRVGIGELSKAGYVPTTELLAPPLPKARLAKFKNAWAGVFENVELE